MEHLLLHLTLVNEVEGEPVMAEERERRREEVRSSLLPGVRCRRLGCQEGLITGSFTRVMCRSRCSTCYHPACWKAARRELVGRGREKECLGTPCNTPDCQAVIPRWCATPRMQVILKNLAMTSSSL